MLFESIKHAAVLLHRLFELEKLLLTGAELARKIKFGSLEGLQLFLEPIKLQLTPLQLSEGIQVTVGKPLLLAFNRGFLTLYSAHLLPELRDARVKTKPGVALALVCGAYPCDESA